MPLSGKKAIWYILYIQNIKIQRNELVKHRGAHPLIPTVRVKVRRLCISLVYFESPGSGRAK